MKANKESIITEILIELEHGIKRGECLAKIGKKWQTKERTFDRLWKEANQRHKNAQANTQTAIATISTAATIERFNSAILKKEEALQILTQIASEATKLGAFGPVSAKGEQISAIKTIADLEGWNEPKGDDPTKKKGTIIKLSNGTEIQL